MAVCHPDILSSLSTADLRKPLGYGSHCWEGVNGNPVLALNYFSQLRLAQSLVRSIESCSEVKSHLGSHLLTPESRLYTQHTNRHSGVANSSTVGEMTDVRVNKT
jgi:hypothetical protein